MGKTLLEKVGELSLNGGPIDEGKYTDLLQQQGYKTISGDNYASNCDCIDCGDCDCDDCPVGDCDPD